MLITNKSFGLRYRERSSGKRMSGYSEINTRDYSYDIQPGQKLKCIRYEGSNAEMYVHPTIMDVNADGLWILHLLNDSTWIFVPWVKSLPAAGIYKDRDMYVEPCEYLFEKNTMQDILAGNIATETYRNGVLIKGDGYGIWYRHGGWRAYSRFESNLQNFVKGGQISLSETESEVLPE